MVLSKMLWLEFLQAHFPADDNPETPAFDMEDTPADEDLVIQNIILLKLA